MFYVKGKLETVMLEDIYTKCPTCGKEHEVDLKEILCDCDADIYGTAVCCQACSERRRETACQRCRYFKQQSDGLAICTEDEGFHKCVIEGDEQTERYYWCAGDYFEEREG